jgi:hypothetical protein
VTNSQDHHLQNTLSLSILADLLSEPGVYRNRLLALPWRSPVADANTFFEPPAGMADLVAEAGMVATRDEGSRWSAYSGLYRMPAWGYLDLRGPPDRFVVDAGVPYFATNDNADGPVRHRLTEIERGVFLADNGETLDFRGRIATWRNLPLARVSGGPSAWQWGILGAAGLIAVLWLVAAPAQGLRRSSTPRPSSEDLPAAPRRWRRIAAFVASATALLTLGNLALLAWIPGLVDTGYAGHLDLSPAEQLAVHLPLAMVVMGVSTAALVAAGWARHWWSRAVRLQYAALAVAGIALVPLLAAWHLIGWGMS